MKKSKIYIKMLLSYLGMLIIPIFLGLLIYFITLNVIKNQSARMNDNMLEMVQREIDQKVEEVNRMASRFAMDGKVQKASRVKDKFDTTDQLMLYDIFKDLSNLSVSENFISDIFIYFENTNTVSSIQGNMSMDLYYHLYYENEEYPLEKFSQYVSQVHYADDLVIRKKNGEDILLFTMSDLGTDIRSASATVCISVKFSEIEKILTSMKWNEQMDIFLITDQNKVIGDPNILPSSPLFEELSSTGKDRGRIIDEKNIMSVRLSEAADWKYVTRMPVKVLERDIQNVKQTAIFGLFLCLLVGFAVSYYLTKKNYNPIKSIVEAFKKYGNTELQAGENEYLWLGDQMNRFFKDQVDTKRLQRRNQKNLKSYYLSQLLQYSYDGSTEKMEQYGIRMTGSYNRVILFEFREVRNSDRSYESCAQENALRKFILINILEEALLNFFQAELVEMGENVAAIISGERDDGESFIVLRENIERVQQITEEQFDFAFAVLVGPVCMDLAGIHLSWQQALELESYVNLLDTDFVSYDEVKDIQPKYHYTVEEEERIINAIKAGDQRTAKENMAVVFEENMEGKVSMDLCRCLIFDMIGTLLKGAGAGGYLDAAKEIDFSRDFSVKQSIPELKAQFFSAVDNICEKITEERKKLDSDNSFSQKVEAYILENYQNPNLNISIASQYFKMTPTYLSGLYKKQTGNSLLDFINSRRIDQAEALLKEGIGVIEAGERSGFGDSSTFIRVFKKKKGVTPGQMKKQMNDF